jgi:hypothetical protein
MGEVIHRRDVGAIRIAGVKLVHDLDEAGLKEALDLFWSTIEARREIDSERE